MKCITCLTKGIEKEAEVIYDGYSLCLEHTIEWYKTQKRVYDKILKKDKK